MKPLIQAKSNIFLPSSFTMSSSDLLKGVGIVGGLAVLGFAAYYYRDRFPPLSKLADPYALLTNRKASSTTSSASASDPVSSTTVPPSASVTTAASDSYQH